MLLVAHHDAVHPVGIAYVSSALKAAGHQVECYVFAGVDDLKNKLEAGYDYVATGGLSSQFKQISAVTSSATEFGIPVMAGGGIITSEPELMARALNLTFAVIGEGEETVVDLVSAIETHGNYRSVHGIAYFENDRFVVTPGRRPILNLDALPWPDYEGFGFEMQLASQKPTDQYYSNVFDSPREYPIITSRSCPFSCTFCYHPIGTKYRQRSIDSIMAELESVIPRYRINIVAIYDELFSYNETRVRQFCERFKDLRNRTPWDVKWYCQLHVASVTDTMLDELRDSGCFMISYGFESYSSTVLKSMKKPATPSQIHWAIHATLDRAISIQGNFIFGDRSETMQTALETLKFWKEHPEAGILLGFILMCPNSELYRLCVTKGIIKDKLEFIRNHLYDTMNVTEMSDRDFCRLQALVDRYSMRYRVYAVPVESAGGSVRVRCPHCKSEILYGNFGERGVTHVVYCRNCARRFWIVRSRMYWMVMLAVSFCVTARTRGWLRALYAKLQKLTGRGTTGV